MKDLPHHMKKLNRRVIRSMHRDDLEMETLPEIPNWPDTPQAKKKKAKVAMKKEAEARVPSSLTPEEKNKKMKHRVPVFDRTNNAKPKHTRSSKKKSPKI